MLTIHHSSFRFFLLALGLMLASPTPASAAETSPPPQLQVGLVDMRRVMAGFYKATAAERSLHDAKERALQEITERREKLRALEAKLQDTAKRALDPAISEEMRASLETQAAQLKAEAHHLWRENAEHAELRNKQLQEQLTRLQRGLLEEITACVQRHAQAAGLDLVFDKSAVGLNAVAVVLSSRDLFDLTEDILKQLNRDAPPE